MIQGLALAHRMRGTRRGATLLLAVLLNLALVPCTMALEVAEETHHGHDCCPPELQLDPSECCQIDVGSTDARTGVVKPDLDDGGPVAAPAYEDLVQLPVRRHDDVDDPPDPPGVSPDLNALFCVYLN